MANVAAQPLDQGMFDEKPEKEPEVDVQGIASQMKQQVQEYMCQDGGKWLECFSLQAENCHKVVAEFVDPCVDAAIRDLVHAKDDASIKRDTQEMANCFNRIFLGQYGLTRRSTPECSQPPDHLR